MRTLATSKATIAVPADIKASSSPKKIPDEFQLAGSLEMQAEEGGQNGEALDKFLLLCNTGKPMQLSGFYDEVIVDFRGSKFHKKTTPIIADHDTSKRIGHSVEQAVIPAGGQATINGRSIKGPQIAALGVRSSEMQIAKGFVSDARRGFPFQVSIGARIKEGYFLEDGEEVEINGAVWSGPLIVATKTIIRELTVTVLGADGDTVAKIAARQSKEIQMDFEAFVKSLHLDPETLTDDQRTALQAMYKNQQPDPVKTKKGKKGKIKAQDPEDDDDDADDDPPARKKIQASDDDSDIGNRRKKFLTSMVEEEERLDSIRAVASEFGHLKSIKVDGKDLTVNQLKAKALKEGWTVTQFELECRRADYPVSSSTGPSIHVIDKNLDAKALECSILRSCDIPVSAHNNRTNRDYGLDKLYDTKTLEASHLKQYQIGNSVNALLALQVRASGKYPGHFRGSDLMVEAHEAWSTIKASTTSALNVVNILENVMNKAAYSGFEGVEAIWRFICGRRPLNDFKPHALYRLDFNGSYRKVGTDGELKHIGMVDSKKTIQADTYGAMISIDRKTQKDDDLGMIVNKARGLGVLGGERIEESVFSLLLSNPGSFFSVGNKNLTTGGGSALSVTSLSTVRQKFRGQVVNGKPIMVSPQILLVGTTLEDTANRLWSEERLGATGDTDALVFTNNSHKGLYRPYVSGYLNNTSILNEDGNALSGQSDTQWYLLANPNAPQGAALVIGFMDGRETPFFDEAETEFNVPGGIQMRSYLDWGTAMHVHQMAQKSAGA